jgi:hypothetical protein
MVKVVPEARTFFSVVISSFCKKNAKVRHFFYKAGFQINFFMYFCTSFFSLKK